MVSTFSMPTDGSAASRVSAILVPHTGRFTAAWADHPGNRTIVNIRHDDAHGEMLNALLQRAHPRVRFVSSQPA